MKCDSDKIKEYINDSIADLKQREIKLRNEGYERVADMKHEAIFHLECILAKIEGFESVE